MSDGNFLVNFGILGLISFITILILCVSVIKKNSFKAEYIKPEDEE